MSAGAARPAPIQLAGGRRWGEPARGPLRWRAVALEAFGIWLATRLALVLVTYFTVVVNSHDSPRTSHGYVLGTQSPVALFSDWFRWDAEWYLVISQIGYFTEQATAFFPLYPLLVHLLTPPVGEAGRYVAALAVSNLASLAAFVGLGLLAASEFGDRDDAARSVGVMAAYPLAFFLAAPYTEALFFALGVFTLLFARRGAWYWAGLAAFGAALTRPIGVILLLPLVIEFARQHRWHWYLGHGFGRLESRTALQFLAAIGAIPLALGVYMAVQWAAFGQPFLFLQVQGRFWQRRPLPIWQTAASIADHLAHNPTLGYWQALLVLDLGLLLGFTLVTILTARSQPVAFTAYMAALLSSCIVTPNLSNLNPISSTGRFLVLAIPVFLSLGRAIRGRSGLDTLLVGGGFMLQAVFLTLYLSGAWVE